MTTVSPSTNVPLPPGADPENVDDWQTDNSSGVTSRLVWSHPATLPEHLFHNDIRLVASQLPDGAIVADDADEGPFVYLAGECYSLADARTIAHALISKVVMADAWTGRTSRVHDTRAPQFLARLQEAVEADDIESLAKELVVDELHCSVCCHEAEARQARVDPVTLAPVEETSRQ